MSQRKVRKYDKGFKENAIQLCLKNNCAYSDIAKDLGLPVSTLVSWVEAYQRDGKNAFPGKGHQKPADAELSQLRKELSIAREERDILKKALGIFSALRK